MKKLLMSLMMCVSVAACESMPSTSALDNFSWASFNPFSEREPVREVKFRQTEEKQIPTPPPSGDALQTELQEIEKLTGNRPQEATPPPASEYAAVLTIAQETNVPMQTATLANEKTAMVPAKKPASSPRMPKENIVAKASWSEAEPAPAAPQGEVKAIPTKDSIRWNQSARPMRPPPL